MTETCLLPAKFFERLPEDTAGYRLSALAQSNAIMVGRADERVTVLSANESDARDLDVAVGTPLLGLDRVIFSDHDDPLEWRVARCHLRNERYVVRFN
jgi:GntR family transcriptional regulator